MSGIITKQLCELAKARNKNREVKNGKNKINRQEDKEW